jgi:hypothetical protein
VDRYAGILTKYDIQALFEHLQECYGNRRKASAKLKLQRKTVYDWEKNTNDVKMLTKRKVLEASLSLDPDWTISFLVQKTSEDFKEILRRQLSGAYKKAMTRKKREDFKESVSMFNQIREGNRGALLDLDIRTMNHMINGINEKADKFGIAGVAQSTKTIPPEYLAERFKELVDVLGQRKLSRTEIIKAFDLPPSFIESICDSVAYIDPQRARIFAQNYEKIGLVSNEDEFKTAHEFYHETGEMLTTMPAILRARHR